MEESKENSEDNSEAMYSARELADMQLPGLPNTERAWLDRAKNGGWKFKEVPGRGRGGVKRIYSPPADVLALIQRQAKGVVREPDTAYTVSIDRYVDVSGSAGPGADVSEETIVKMRVDAMLLRERVGSNFNHIKIAGVSGDSMEPTLSHGDQVLVDTSVTNFRDDAIYAIQQDGFLRFKRVKLKLDGSIVVKSDATPDDVETYTREEAARFFVIGIVIPFKFGRFKTWNVPNHAQKPAIAD